MEIDRKCISITLFFGNRQKIATVRKLFKKSHFNKIFNYSALLKLDLGTKIESYRHAIISYAPKISFLFPKFWIIGSKFPHIVMFLKGNKLEKNLNGFYIKILCVFRSYFLFQLLITEKFVSNSTKEIMLNI